MDKEQVAAVLTEIGTLLELKGENPFKTRAYHNAARTLEGLAEPLEKVVASVLKARPATVLFEAANPRHRHEWSVWRDARLPDDKVLIPGCVMSTSNYVEHPTLIAEQLCQYADIVGRERVIAGTDCGFGTFAGRVQVDTKIVWMKLASLAEGAAMAAKQLQ